MYICIHILPTLASPRIDRLKPVVLWAGFRRLSWGLSCSPFEGPPCVWPARTAPLRLRTPESTAGWEGHVARRAGELPKGFADAIIALTTAK
jgi:hypothetical protein